MLDAFFYHTLLRDYAKRQVAFFLPHHGLHRNRLEEVLMEWNRRIAGTGQDQWVYDCASCMKLYTNPGGQISKLNVQECSFTFV